MKRFSIQFLWVISLIFTTIMALTFLVMPFTADMNNPNRNRMMLITGIVFWISLIIGYLAWGIAVLIARKDKINKKIIQKRRGVLFGNTITAFLDMIFLVSFVWVVISIFFRKSNDYSVYICIFTMIQSANMHGLFNGYIYKRFIIKKAKENK